MVRPTRKVWYTLRGINVNKKACISVVFPKALWGTFERDVVLRFQPGTKGATVVFEHKSLMISGPVNQKVEGDEGREEFRFKFGKDDHLVQRFAVQAEKGEGTVAKVFVKGDVLLRDGPSAFKEEYKVQVIPLGKYAELLIGLVILRLLPKWCRSAVYGLVLFVPVVWGCAKVWPERFSDPALAWASVERIPYLGKTDFLRLTPDDWFDTNGGAPSWYYGIEDQGKTAQKWSMTASDPVDEV